jgi:hypothetical protein
VDSLLKVATRKNKMYSVKNGLKLLPNGLYAKKKGFLETREQSSKFLDVIYITSIPILLVLVLTNLHLQ